MKPLSSLLTLAAALVCLDAPAGERIVYFRDGQSIDPQEVTRILRLPAPLTRSIRLLNVPSTPSAASDDPVGSVEPGRTSYAVQVPAYPSGRLPEGPSEVSTEGGALALPLRFAFDSAEIVPAHRAQLDAMAAGIAALPEEQAVLIEGHTDATGTAEYNLALSQRRADAVKQYLVAVHGLSPRRLRTVGYGPQRPLEGLQGANGLHRRVQFRGIEARTAQAPIAAQR